MQTPVITNLNWADYSIIGIIAVSVLISFSRGFVREMFSLFTWIVAFWIGFKFSTQFSDLLSSYIKTPSIRVIAAFIILFVVTLILGSMLNFLITQLIVKTGLSGTDRMLGTIFGIARGVLLVSVILLMASLTAFAQDQWWRSSTLIPHFQWLIIWLKGFLPAKFSELSHLAS